MHLARLTHRTARTFVVQLARAGGGSARRSLSHHTHPPPMPSTQRTLDSRVLELELLTRNLQFQLADLQHTVNGMKMHAEPLPPAPPPPSPPPCDARDLVSW